MDKEEKDYIELQHQISIAKDKLDAVQNLDEVKAYLSLKKDYELLKSSEEMKYTLMKYKKYSKCKHLYICVGHSQELGDISKRFYDFGCLKCGLNTELCRYDDDELTLDEKINKHYAMMSSIKGKVSLNMDCDLELATAIYNKIMEANPYIDDDTVIKYLEIAVDNMRNINVSETRKQSRIKRLGLRKNFKRW